MCPLKWVQNLPNTILYETSIWAHLKKSLCSIQCIICQNFNLWKFFPFKKNFPWIQCLFFTHLALIAACLRTPTPCQLDLEVHVCLRRVFLFYASVQRYWGWLSTHIHSAFYPIKGNDVPNRSSQVRRSKNMESNLRLKGNYRERRGETMLLVSSLLPAGVTTAYRKAVCDSGRIAANLNWK